MLSNGKNCTRFKKACNTCTAGKLQGSVKAYNAKIKHKGLGKISLTKPQEHCTECAYFCILLWITYRTACIPGIGKPRYKHGKGNDTWCT